MSTALATVELTISQTIDVDTSQKEVPSVFVGDTVVLTNGTTWEVADITQGQIRLRDENGKTRNLNGTLGGSYSGGNQLRIERIVRHSENAEQSPVVTALATVEEPRLTSALAICETPAPATGTSKLSLPVAPSLLAAIQNRHNLSNEELSRYIEYALVLTLREIFPLVEEMQRRFKILGPRQSDTICGCRSFQNYCNKVLHRTEQGVYKMLREAKFFTQLKPGDEVVVRTGKTKEIWKVDKISGDKVTTQSTTKKGPQTLIFEKYTGKEVNGGKQRILCAATPEVKAAIEKQIAAPVESSDTFTGQPDPLTVAGLLDWFNTVDTIERKKGRWLDFGIFQHRKRDVTVALNFPALDPATAKAIAEYFLQLQKTKAAVHEPVPDPDQPDIPTPGEVQAKQTLPTQKDEFECESATELPPFALTSPCYEPLPLCPPKMDLLTPDEALAFLDELSKLPWERHINKMYGKELPAPQKVQWMGVPPHPKSYSGGTPIVGGGTLKPIAWTPAALAIKKKVEEFTGETFDSLNFNYYHDEKAHLGWHRDKADVGLWTASIASVSLGATRTFQVRRGWDGEIVSFPLVSGSLVVMPPGFQRDWLHCVAKTVKPCGPRINLTFRRMMPTAQDLVRP